MKILVVLTISFAVAFGAPAEDGSVPNQYDNNDIMEENAHLVRLAEVYHEDEGGEGHEGDGGRRGRYERRYGQVKGRQPNIVLVVADDLGYNDVGWNGSPDIKTPNLNALAAEGVILNNYYVQPVCTPSRVQLLSGVHEVAASLCHDVINSGQRNALPSNLPTLADKLKEVGYATHLIGKWNLGHWEKQFLPTYRGFDTFYGFVNVLTDHYSHSAYERFRNVAGQVVTFNGHDFWENDVQTYEEDGIYTTHLFTSRFQKIFNDHVRGRNKNQPFFIDLSYAAPHWPLQVPDQYLTQYANIKDLNRRLYAGMVSALDEAIGNITLTLKRDRRTWENTIFIFTTDNGATPFFGGDNYPLRGRKQTWFEAGVKGVGFVTSPWIHEKWRGKKTDAWLHISDFYPTLVNLAGGSTAGQALNGYDVWSSINGLQPSRRVELLHGIDVFIPPRGTARPDSPFDVRINAALRLGQYKIVTGNAVDGNWYQTPTVPDIALPRVGPKPPNDQVIGQEQFTLGYVVKRSPDSSTKNLWLFNVRDDPTEQNDISAAHPEIVDILLNRLAWYQANVYAPCSYPRMDLLANPANFNGNFYPWAEDGQPPAQF